MPKIDLFMKLAFLALIFGQCQGRRLQIRAPIDDAGCEGRLDLPKFAKVNQVCEECYSLYKEIDVYKLCRADCFGTKIFYGCMEALLVKDDIKSEVAGYLENAHSGYYDLLNKKK